MSDYAYGDDSDDVVDQDDTPVDAAAPTQDDASAATDLPDVTGGYDMSTDPLMMDDVLNGAGSWVGGDYDLSSDFAPTDAPAAPADKVVPVVPSDGPGGASDGPAIVQTLADTGGSSGPATYVPIVANTGAGLASLSDAVGGKVVPIVPGDYVGADGGDDDYDDDTDDGDGSDAEDAVSEEDDGAGSLSAFSPVNSGLGEIGASFEAPNTIDASTPAATVGEALVAGGASLIGQPAPDPYVGALTEQFESSNRGPATVSSGWMDKAHTKPDPGGVSYGSYQLASKKDRPRQFLLAEGARWKALFGNSIQGTPQFSAAWKAAAASDPEAFKAAQYDYMVRTHYNVQLGKLKKDQGIDFGGRSLALRNVIFSTATQHGPNTPIIDKAVASVRKNGLDPASPNSDAAIIQEIFRQRALRSRGTASRYRQESAAALQMLLHP